MSLSFEIPGDDEYPNTGQARKTNLPTPPKSSEIDSDDAYQEPDSPHGNGAMLDSTSPMAPYFRLYRWHPFTELFCVIAEWFIEVPDENLTKKQVALRQRAQMKKDHPVMFRGATILDLLLLLFIVTALCVAVVYIALSAIGVDIEVVRIPLPWSGQS